MSPGTDTLALPDLIAGPALPVAVVRSKIGILGGECMPVQAVCLAGIGRIATPAAQLVIPRRNRL